MTKQPFARLSVLLLATIALLQLVRLVARWPVTIDGITVPVWVSAALAAIAGGVALLAWREARA